MNLTYRVSAVLSLCMAKHTKTFWKILRKPVWVLRVYCRRENAVYGRAHVANCGSFYTFLSRS